MTTRTSTYPLRLPVSIKTEAEKLAAAEGASLNQFLATAVAERSPHCARRATSPNDEAEPIGRRSIGS